MTAKSKNKNSSMNNDKDKGKHSIHSAMKTTVRINHQQQHHHHQFHVISSPTAPPHLRKHGKEKIGQDAPYRDLLLRGVHRNRICNELYDCSPARRHQHLVWQHP